MSTSEVRLCSHLHAGLTTLGAGFCMCTLVQKKTVRPFDPASATIVEEMGNQTTKMIETLGEEDVEYPSHLPELLTEGGVEKATQAVKEGIDYPSHTPELLTEDDEGVEESSTHVVNDAFQDMIDQMDKDDPDYERKLKLYTQIMRLQTSLPVGWRKNPNDGSETSNAPYLHENGRESYKNPNFAKILALAEQAQQQERQEQEEALSDQTRELPAAVRSRIKRLRLMLQSGLPLAAVEQQAKLHGIEMSLVLQTEETRQNESSKTDKSNRPPSPLLKKYKRMLKRGVPLCGVQQLAFAEAGLPPEHLNKALEDVLEISAKSNADGEDQIQYSPCKKRVKTKHTGKYHRMVKSGLPFGAIRQTALRDGLSEQELREALGDLYDTAMKNGQALDDDGPDKEKPAYFAILEEGKSVSFPAESDLASLVRKMAQTVQKRATRSGAATEGSQMTVDARTLYHAMGALQGVQLARDRYNATCENHFNEQETKAKRQAFAEVARAIGMDAPKTYSTPVNIAGLDELIVFLKRHFAEDLSTIQSQLQDGWYDFDSLALLYAPGSKVLAKNAGGGGVDMICQVAWNRYEEGKTVMGQMMKYFKVCFQYVVAVGASQATIAEVVEGMEFFEGRRSVQKALNFVPLSAYTQTERDQLMSRYRHRGEVYNKVALRGNHAYMAYQKGCFFLKRGGSGLKGAGNPSAALATGGRIIVDTQGAYDHGHTLGIGYDPMVMGIKYKYKEYTLHLRSVQQGKETMARGNSRGGRKAADFADDGLILFDQVPEDFLDMVWPAVVGFSLTAKAWGDVLVDGLEEIQFQEDIFDRLVLPERRKRMVKALVRNTNTSFQDLVQGKGEGTVFLLYGSPGVGKTLTAEAIAELLHKPLYSLSMGTLGTKPEELEQRLGEIMNLSAKWDALILLDEADSFLETRSSTSSLERNAMVSVMLKLVEYFSGILFLTSNRIDSLDPAFQTRITLALRYEALDVAARTQVWKNLLTKSGFDLKTNNINPQALAKAAPLNGREIKNALRLAMSMAAEENQELSHATLMATVSIVNDYKTVAGDEVVSTGCFAWRKKKRKNKSSYN